MTVLLTQTHGGVHNRTRGSAHDRHLYIHIFITTCRNAKDSFTHMQTHEGIYNRIRENPNDNCTHIHTKVFIKIWNSHDSCTHIHAKVSKEIGILMQFYRHTDTHYKQEVLKKNWRTVIHKRFVTVKEMLIPVVHTQRYS